MFKEYIKNLTKWVIIPLVLFCVAIALSVIFFFNSDINPNILLHNELESNITKKNNVIFGKFNSVDNYLGIITIRLEKKNIINADSVFRIKNTLDNDWYYTATVSATQYYSFSFPIIEKSKNIIYQFEIKPLLENKQLSISKQEPVLVSYYIYPKEIFLKKSRLLLNFIKKKVSHYVEDQKFLKVFLIYNLPLSLYLFYNIFLHRFIPEGIKQKAERLLKVVNKPILLIILILIMIDIFVSGKYSDSVTFWLTILWVLGTIAYRLEARYSFGLAMIFLTFCPFLLIVPMDSIAEKSAIWVYVMIVVGTFQSILNISPICKKIIKIKFTKAFIKLLKYVFLTFDRLVVDLINYFKRFFIFSIKILFKKLPITFYDWLIFIGKLILFIIIMSIIFATSAFVILKINNTIQVINHKKIRLSMNPVIKTIEPTLVYKATKIVIYGKNFGWEVKEARALIDGKEIDAVLWTDSKIIFPVPLEWKDGSHKIWIEKQIDWDGKKQKAKSEVFEIKILPITGGYTEDDRLYFEQIKTWQKETREVNGYE